MNYQLDVLFKALRKLILDGTITKAACVDVDTFICYTHETPMGKQYCQHTFNELPHEWKTALKHHKAGENVGFVKILAVFDVWEPKVTTPKMPVAS